MELELQQGRRTHRLTLDEGVHSLGGGPSDSVRVRGLHPSVYQLRIEGERLLVKADEQARVGGLPCPTGVLRVVLPGETLELGRARLRVVEGSGEGFGDSSTEEPAPQATRAGFAALLERAPAAAGRPRLPTLQVLSGPQAGERLPILGDSVTLGRGLDASMRIRDRAVSRRHLALARRDGGWWVRPAPSVNPPELNGIPLEAETELVAGDVLRLGRTLLRLELPEASPATPEVRSPGPATPGAHSPGQARSDGGDAASSEAHEAPSADDARAASAPGSKLRDEAGAFAGSVAISYVGPLPLGTTAHRWLAVLAGALTLLGTAAAALAA